MFNIGESGAKSPPYENNVAIRLLNAYNIITYYESSKNLNFTGFITRRNKKLSGAKWVTLKISPFL